ncbi:MAG TPA: general secretion pathway protein GspB, partial [Steroidobacteraceae bacterium]
GTLPPLRLDLHVYAANPADRYAFINMHKVREGDLTPEGVRVSQITREGVVLDYRGTEFLLGRE